MRTNAVNLQQHLSRRRTGKGVHPIIEISIYIHSPLRSASGLLHLCSRDDTHTHGSEQGRGCQPLLKCPSARSCSRPPVSLHIICPPHPARCSLRQRIPERPADQSAARTRRRRNHNKSTCVILHFR
ncbi:hypothetical protein CesoFtcFv8_010182 [Champsocephalus esox]|nr:hypothetical protein CesoFtcFv8_010182 [Champsocephalus esox]